MPINIDYTAIDFDALKNELINYLKETKTFKDVEYASSNIRNWVELQAYLSSLFGFYINSIANEPFLPSAKRYKNLNRIARLLNYNPRGDKSSNVSVIGSLNPEYCFGKEDVYFEIPAYSIFPSNKTASDGSSFYFSNIDHFGYVVQSFGTRIVELKDFTYDGQKLPLTMPSSYWSESTGSTGTTGTTGTSGTPSFDPTKLVLNLSDTLPLSILNRLDTTNYKKFDVENVPLFSPSDSSSIGQPFNRNISVNTNSLRIQPDTIYYVVFNYDNQTSTPYLSLLEEGVRLDEKKDDVILSIKLNKDNTAGTYYTLQEVQNNSKGRFYLGVMGMKNLESVSFSFDKLESVENGIKQVHLDINKSGDKPPFMVLVDGVTYSFNSGRISSQIFDVNSWDTTQSYYNINLNIVSPNSPTYNYDATLTVTSKEPGINEVTIAKIYPAYTDPDTNIKAVGKDIGQRFGNLQAIPAISLNDMEQKTGIIEIPEGITSIFVKFESAFTRDDADLAADYKISLTPSENVLVWYTNKSEDGFTINIEPNTGFSGNISWLATKLQVESIRTVTVAFDTSIPEINGSPADYSIFLTPSDNVRVWYSDKTANGFKINVEKDFSGTVSYSTIVFSSDQSVLDELSTSTQKKGSITFSGQVYSKDIAFDVDFPNTNYGLHVVSNKNYNVWYSNKTTSGFTLNIENDYEGQVSVDWYADYSPTYIYQKHGMVEFSGQVSSAGTIPGIRFNNISETFAINNLKQGQVLFSRILRSGAVDQSNNRLGLEFAADRVSENEIKVNITEPNISYTDIRVFVKNESDIWEEWSDATSMVSSVDINPGSNIFFVRVNEYKQIEIYFGDGTTHGTNPVGKEIYIFGLHTVGKDGNVPPNTVGPSVVLSKEILGDETINVQFEEQFVQLLGLKSSSFTSSDGLSTPTSLYDTDGTELTETELIIKQPVSATGGAFVETTEELRKNAGNANLRQDRIVSLEDYRTYCEQAFSDYIMKTQVLSYNDIKNSGLLPSDQLEKYWFNFIFIIALSKTGGEIPKIHKDYILNSLKNKFKSMATVEHELLSAKFVPIDIRIRIKKLKSASSDSIQSSIRLALRSYFNFENHEMGETIEYGPIEKIILNTSGVQNAEIALNKYNGLSAGDMDVDAEVSANETLEEVKRKKVLEILAKDPTLLNIIDPLFDIKDPTTNERKWVFSANINLNKYEFPQQGNIIIEMEN